MARTEVSNFRVEFEILLKRIRVEDAEAHQKMMRMKYEPFSEIFNNYFSHLTICHFDLSPFVAKPVAEKLYHSLYSARSNSKNYHQLSRQI